MKGSLFVGRYMFLRMLRDLPSLAILLLVPTILMPILGAVFSWLPADIPYMRGVSSPMAFFAFGILLMFQLYGGSYSLTYVKNAFLGPMRWRLRGLPCEPGAMVLGVVAAATLISLCQGLALVAFSRFALGVRWGSLPIVFLVLCAVSVLSQLVYLTLLLALRNPSAATSLGWFYAYGSCMMGGLIFPLPLGEPLVHFMATYGNPYSLALTAIREAAPGGSPAKSVLCIAILLAAAGLFAAITVALGKKKLA